MSSVWLSVLLFVLAFIVTMAVYPFVLRFAKKHNIVDNPNARKLQRVPVPVMGGTAVYFGIIVALFVANSLFNCPTIWVGIVSMTVMFVIGLWDDIKDVPATLRFIIEIALVWGIMVAIDSGIDDFHGLWGYGEVSLYIAMPLSIIAGVGIINAINLIDGVDGYSSGYGMMACTLFAVLFFSVGDRAMGSYAIICAGALLPFFVHNLFGKTSKMFIGDSGTLMLGTVMTVFVFAVLSRNTTCQPLVEQGCSLVAFTLAVLAIPVFDTLRVMSVRIVRGKSPFHPDKTHLHHLFIEMGFSHVGTAVSIILTNFLIVLVWWLSWKFGASLEVQVYIVMGLGILTTFGFYKFMRSQQMKGPEDEDGFPTGGAVWKVFCAIGEFTHIERGGFWKFMQKLVDGKILGGGIKSL